MTFIEAAKLSPHVRRKNCAKHADSDGQGWIDARHAFEQGRGFTFQIHSRMTRLLTWKDLMADDWEAKV